LAARRFSARVRASVANLRDHPHMGQVHPDFAAYRYLVVGSFPIAYRLADDDVILVLRVWDARQDPDRLAPE
jgi:plasmid stabilization system protein ParE